MMPDAFFHREGDAFVPTVLTRGPWDAHHQHGGPPAALLATIIEERHPRPGTQPVRVTVEILGPVPIAPLRLKTTVLRDGRSVELLGGSLWAGEREVMRATLLRLRTAALPEAAESPPVPAPPGPEHGRVASFFPTGHDVGYHTAMEVAFIQGGFMEIGPATVWMRMRCPLIDGEEVRPLARVLVAADSGNGVSGALDYRRWIFINPDLTVYLHRLPAGEWVCLDAATTSERHGIGLAESIISDQERVIGRGLQGLFIAQRDPPA